MATLDNPGYANGTEESRRSTDNRSNGSGSIGTPEAKGSITSRSEVNYLATENQSRLICESKNRNRKFIRFMTVIAYIFFVSLGAIVLSLYYFFIWVPRMQLGPFPDPNTAMGAGGVGLHSLSSGPDPYGRVSGGKRGKVHHLVSNQQEAQLSNPQLYPDDNLRWIQVTSETTQSQSEHNELPTRSSLYSLISKKRSNTTKNIPSTQEPTISTSTRSQPP